MAAKQIRFVKVGAMTIITTSPAEFLAAQSEGHDR
jgi:hypothetical protein